MRKIWGVAGLAALALAVSACGSSSSSSAGSTSAAGGSSSSAAAGGTTITMATSSGPQVLTNAQGLTLYWFAPDNSTTSKCTGSCATYWPPVMGPATAGSGVTGTLGTITRSDPSGTQVTYDGHPLYTYAADSPGQAKGNGLNVSGGVWYEMTVSGATPAAGTSSSSGGGGGGYGY